MRLAPFLLLLMFASSPVAQAQNQVEIDKMISQLNASTDVLDKIGSNIGVMSISVPEREYLPVIQAINEIERASFQYETALNIAQIAAVMLDARDYQRTLRFLKIQCRRAKRSGEGSVKRINSTLVGVTANALISELSKARDLIQSLAETPLCK